MLRVHVQGLRAVLLVEELGARLQQLWAGTLSAIAGQGRDGRGAAWEGVGLGGDEDRDEQADAPGDSLGDRSDCL